MALATWETKVTEAPKYQTQTGWKNDPASDAQIAWLTKLVSSKDPTDLTVVLAAALLKNPAKTKGQMSDAIEAVKALPTYVAKVPVVQAAAPEMVSHAVTVGIYDTKPHLPEPTEVPGHARWIIVYESKYGKRVKALYKSWETKSGFSWKKASTAHLNMIRNGKYGKVDLATVKKLGKDVGFCMYCGLTLTDPQSKHLGYGPICAVKYGLPH